MLFVLPFNTNAQIYYGSEIMQYYTMSFNDSNTYPSIIIPDYEIEWKGIPIVDYETVVQLIGAVKTKTGLQVKYQLDLNKYEKGKKVSNKEMDSINIKKMNFTVNGITQLDPSKSNLYFFTLP